MIPVGCGYRFTVQGPGPVIGEGTATVPEGPPVRLAIQDLTNRSFEPNLEIKYTGYLRNQFKIGSGADIVQKEKTADFLLKGTIESVQLPSLTFSRTQTQESRVTVTVKVQVQDRGTGKPVWTQTSVGSGEFFVNESPNSAGSGGIQFNRVLQDRALEQAGQVIASDLASRFLFARNQGMFTPQTSKDHADSNPSSDSPNLIEPTPLPSSLLP